MAEPLSCVLYQIVAAFVTAWDKQGCKSAVSTNLDVPTATLKKRTAEVTKSIPEIYDEEVAAASVEPSTAGQYPVFKQTAGNQHSLGKDGTFTILPEWYQQLFTSHEITVGKDIDTYGTVLLPAIQGIFRIRGYRAAISTSAKRYIGKLVSWAWKRDIKSKKKQK
ncbi:hypothetical protein T06_16677 [Trichinella sp. T6]|nr:hypothetical protein T06_16677 [Trichinella sp. T6]